MRHISTLVNPTEWCFNTSAWLAFTESISPAQNGLSDDGLRGLQASRLLLQTEKMFVFITITVFCCMLDNFGWAVSDQYFFSKQREAATVQLRSSSKSSRKIVTSSALLVQELSVSLLSLAVKMPILTFSTKFGWLAGMVTLHAWSRDAWQLTIT